MRIPVNTLLYSTTVCIWGSTWYAITLQLSQVPPMLSVIYRFALASVILFAICLATGTRLKYSARDQFFLVLQGATWIGAGYYLLYIVSGKITSGLIATMFSCILFLNVINLRIFMGIPARKGVLAAAALGIVGVVLAFQPAPGAAGKAIGIVPYLIATVSVYLSSIGNVIALRNARTGMSPFASNAWSMLYGSLLLIVLWVAQGGSFQFSTDWGYLLPLLYLSLFGSVTAFCCYLKLMDNIGADRAAYALIMAPVLALVISTIFEGFQWSGVRLLGACCVFLGNILVLAPEHVLKRVWGMVSGARRLARTPTPRS